LEVLSHVLWSEPIEQPAKAAALIMKRCNPAAAQIQKLLGEAEDIVGNTNPKQLDECIASIKKLQEIHAKLDAMKESERRNAALEFADEHIKNLKVAATAGIGF
jgi:succinate dehydrogenase/fumarate reductase flavoprotein subunit